MQFISMIQRMPPVPPLSLHDPADRLTCKHADGSLSVHAANVTCKSCRASSDIGCTHSPDDRPRTTHQQHPRS